MQEVYRSSLDYLYNCPIVLKQFQNKVYAGKKEHCAYKKS